MAVSYSGVLPLSPDDQGSARELGSESRCANRASVQAGAQQLAVVMGQTDAVTDDLVVAYDPESSVRPSPGAVRGAVRTYFSSVDSLDAMEQEIAVKDPVMAVAARSAHGLRILRQDPWECLASYVLSVNNNIPNIARAVEHFARCLGSPVGLGEFGFPPPELVACRENEFLRQSGCGFRDRHLKDAAERVVSGEVDLDSLSDMPTEQARERLMRIRGVGPKVADCVLLFAYHRLDVFPADVWIARAISRFYMGGRPTTPRVAREEGVRRFGKLAGYAQEYLFYHVRSGR